VHEGAGARVHEFLTLQSKRGVCLRAVSLVLHGQEPHLFPVRAD